MEEKCMEQYHFIQEVLRLFSLDETDCYSILFWRCEEAGSIVFFVIVNDIFWWDTADLEPITSEDLPAMRQALADVYKVVGKDTDVYEGFKLWAARKRQMRPQQPAYPKDERLWGLFDACGPVRDV